MRPITVVLSLVFIVALLVPAETWAVSYRITPDSQQLGPSHASIGGSVNASSRTPGTPGTGGGPAPASTSGGETPSSAPTPSPANPTLPSNSPRLANPHPGGPGSFWYTTVAGEHCVYEAASNGPCFNLVEPAAPAEPPVNPTVLAATAAERLSLGAGQIQASPSTKTAGLTGTASWFWLEPAPAAHSLSVSLHREQVTVIASAKEVLWAFGDGQQTAGGPGLPYHPGPPPTGAVRHAYQTRCLPGDRGHDPNVLSSCRGAGYTAAANVVWAISYQATGPVSASGVLPARTTTTSIAYPVSEARAFLTASGGGG
jgi:hypothetical protein